MLHATIRQLPVGQGGFLIGQISDAHNREFTYAFDCGSINREHFEQGLSFCSPGKIDVLFISHMDADHINGIDALASKMQIDTVILPCLDALHMTMIACEAAGAAGLRMSVQSFLSDPSTWFADRGIKQIFHVQRGDNTAEAIPFNPDSERSIEDKIVPVGEDAEPNRPYTIRSQTVSEAKTLRSGEAVVRMLGEHTSISINFGGGSPSWLLIPYVHPFPGEDIASFRRAVGGLFPRTFASRAIASEAFKKTLLELLRNEDSRKALKACYSILSKDNNKPSLSLYAGPHPRVLGYKQIFRTDQFYEWTFRSQRSMIVSSSGLPESKGGAWLCTGDANLETDDTRTPWLLRFKHLLKEVEVFNLPHHGSNRSIHNDVIEQLAGAVMIACAATGCPKHPHHLLLGRLRMSRQCVWQVSEESESGYRLEVSITV
jgi:hypothetical protein